MWYRPQKIKNLVNRDLFLIFFFFAQVPIDAEQKHWRLFFWDWMPSELFSVKREETPPPYKKPLLDVLFSIIYGPGSLAAKTQFAFDSGASGFPREKKPVIFAHIAEVYSGIPPLLFFDHRKKSARVKVCTISESIWYFHSTLATSNT